MTECSVEGCTREADRRGWCSLHYQRWARHGDPLISYVRRYYGATCSIEGCERRARANTWCSMHNARWLTQGDPEHRVNPQARPTPGKTPAFKKQWLIDYKLAAGCADCGYREHAVALDFDHLPGQSKLRNIKHGRTIGWAALMAEVAKCEVVCANCHRVRTVDRRCVVEIA